MELLSIQIDELKNTRYYLILQSCSHPSELVDLVCTGSVNKNYCYNKMHSAFYQIGIVYLFVKQILNPSPIK